MEEGEEVQEEGGGEMLLNYIFIHLYLHVIYTVLAHY